MLLSFQHLTTNDPYLKITYRGYQIVLFVDKICCIFDNNEVTFFRGTIKFSGMMLVVRKESFVALRLTFLDNLFELTNY